MINHVELNGKLTGRGVLFGDICLRQTSGLDGVYLSPDSLVFSGLEPHVFPVLVANSGRDASADGFDTEAAWSPTGDRIAFVRGARLRFARELSAAATLHSGCDDREI